MNISSGLGWKRLKLEITWSISSIAFSSPQYLLNTPPIAVWYVNLPSDHPPAPSMPVITSSGKRLCGSLPLSIIVIKCPGYPLSTNLVAALIPATPAPRITILLFIYSFYIFKINIFIWFLKIKVTHLLVGHYSNLYKSSYEANRQ